VVRTALAIVGILLVLYAISDHPLYGGGPGFGAAQGAIVLFGALIALSSRLSKPFTESVLLFVFVGLSMLGASELLLESLLGPRLRPAYEADDRLIFRLVPGKKTQWIRLPVNGGETITYRVNSQGFRGPELSGQKVVVYGDSYINAFYSSDENTFAGKLEQHLGVGVVNAGISSYGPDQISLKMEAELGLLKPALVIVSVFAGNDYGDLIRNKLFTFDANGALVARPWRLSDDVRTSFWLAQRESILKRAIKVAFPTQSGDWEAQEPEFLLAQAAAEFASYQRDDVVTNTHADFYNADISLDVDSASARYKVRLMRAVLARIVATAKSHDVPLIFLFIPHPSELGEYDTWRIDRGNPNYDGDRPVALLESIASELAVPYLSPMAGHDPNKFYFRGGDDHWNDAGQDLAAQSMARFVTSLGLL
jgi:hypothetical protein